MSHEAMTQLSINISDELKAKIETRAAEAGYPTLEQYVQSVLRKDADPEDFGAPEHLKLESRQQLEMLLKEALASPAREMNASDWVQMRQAFIERHRDGRR